MSKEQQKPDDEMDVKQEPVRRLCSEIQLFDLCELEQCRKKDGRFRSDEAMLSRFERIVEQEERPVANLREAAEEEDELEGSDFDDAFGADDEDAEWDD